MFSLWLIFTFNHFICSASGGAVWWVRACLSHQKKASSDVYSWTCICSLPKIKARNAVGASYRIKCDISVRGRAAREGVHENHLFDWEKLKNEKNREQMRRSQVRRVVLLAPSWFVNVSFHAGGLRRQARTAAPHTRRAKSNKRKQQAGRLLKYAHICSNETDGAPRQRGGVEQVRRRSERRRLWLPASKFPAFVMADQVVALSSSARPHPPGPHGPPPPPHQHQTGAWQFGIWVSFWPLAHLKQQSQGPLSGCLRPAPGSTLCVAKKCFFSRWSYCLEEGSQGPSPGITN